MDKREQALYEILGISQNATLKEIKIAYRQKAMEYHPDMNPIKNNDECHKMMCKINESYNTLRNPDLRAFYDETLFEKGKYDVSNEEVTPPSQETSGNEPKTYKRTYKPNSAQYKYYNTIDFNEYMQEEFIE